MVHYHPELRFGRFIPPISAGPRISRIVNRFPAKGGPAPEDMQIDDVEIPGPPASPVVEARIYRPRTLRDTAPAMIWIHGGGMVIGNHLMDDKSSIGFARTLGITVVSVNYRLSPRSATPAALEDIYAALRWLNAHAEARGIDPARIAIAGASAGGGLAAGAAQLALDRGDYPLAFQLLIYPMLDDRTSLRTDSFAEGARVWTPKSNVFGWTSYLGHAPGPVPESPYAAPARRESLSGLPPAWVGVGTLDVFHDEDVSYARRLHDAGIPCHLEVVEGAFHAFDVLTKREVSRNFRASQIRALTEALQLN